MHDNLHAPLERPGPSTVPRVYTVFPWLAERRYSDGRQLSGGEQEMLLIAHVLLLTHGRWFWTRRPCALHR